MEITKTINAQDIEFWTWRGAVTAVWDRAPKEAAPEPADPGAVPPVEIRVEGEDGSKRTVRLGVAAAFAPGDDVSFLYGRSTADDRGPLLGIANHTSGLTSVTMRRAGPVGYRHPFPLGLVGIMERLTLFGAALVLSALTLTLLQRYAGVPFTLWLWTAVGVADLMVLWGLSGFAHKREKAVDRSMLAQVEAILRGLSAEPARAPAAEEAA